MKKFIFLFVLLYFLFLVFYFRDNIYNFAVKIINGNNKEIVMDKVNEYYRDIDFTFVRNTKNFKPKNINELYSVYYTIINSGKSEFTFYCDEEYTKCIHDVEDLANNQATLSDINNYVHPFNSFSNIETEYNDLGKVTVMIKKNYSTEEIKQINKKIDELSNTLINKNDSLYNNILRVHDYIVNNTVYDSEKADTGDSNYKSGIAYGPLFEGYAICGGYTDLMQLFLEKMDVISYRVSSHEHVWNAVYYNNNWVNLDLTWDDPVADDGNNYLNHDYFLISTNKLLTLETSEHNIDYNHYPELKEA